jgi:hypothetical protein
MKIYYMVMRSLSLVYGFILAIHCWYCRLVLFLFEKKYYQLVLKDT